MITAVIDTNVFVSALIGGGTPLAVIESTRLGKSRLLVTTEIVTEMERTLERPKFMRHFQRHETEPRRFISDYTTLARYVTPVGVTDCPIADQKDLMFIECAVAGNADFIVSGDHHLLDLKAYKDISILTPAQFLAILNPPAEHDPDSAADEPQKE